MRFRRRTGRASTATTKARGLRSARLIGLHSSRAHAVQLRLQVPRQRLAGPDER